MRIFDYTRLRKFLLVALSGLILTGILIAQIDTASIVGTVKDPSGAVIPSAKVTVNNQATGETQTVTASSNGNYAFPYLRVGSYTMTVDAGCVTQRRLR